jgi:hypothetical protein
MLNWNAVFQFFFKQYNQYFNIKLSINQLSRCFWAFQEPHTKLIKIISQLCKIKLKTKLVVKIENNL